MARKNFSQADKSYFGYGLACIGYAAFNRYYSHSPDTYYFFIGAVLLGLGLARGKITMWTGGRLLERELVWLVIGAAMSGYALFERIRYRAVDPLFVAIGAGFFFYSIASVAKRKMKDREVTAAIARIQPASAMPAAELALTREKAENGDGGSQRRLGYLYQSGGHGLQKSLEDAYFWYALAAKSGFAGAESSRQKIARSLTAGQIHLLDDRVRNWRPVKRH